MWERICSLVVYIRFRFDLKKSNSPHTMERNRSIPAASNPGIQNSEIPTLNPTGSLDDFPQFFLVSVPKATPVPRSLLPSWWRGGP